jgi:DNA polymerase-3 subunit alpha
MGIRIADAAVVPQVAAELSSARGGNGVVRLFLNLAQGGEATILAGRNFVLDAELASRLQKLVGEKCVDLSVQEPPRLALVG